MESLYRKEQKPTQKQTQTAKQTKQPSKKKTDIALKQFADFEKEENGI
jgi:hypothetical protein